MRYPVGYPMRYPMRWAPWRSEKLKDSDHWLFPYDFPIDFVWLSTWFPDAILWVPIGFMWLTVLRFATLWGWTIPTLKVMSNLPAYHSTWRRHVHRSWRLMSLWLLSLRLSLGPSMWLLLDPHTHFAILCVWTTSSWEVYAKTPFSLDLAPREIVNPYFYGGPWVTWCNLNYCSPLSYNPLVYKYERHQA